MPSQSERSFGQRYTKARDLVQYLEELGTYAPGNPDIEPANLTTFLDDVDQANSDVASKLSALQTIREERFNMYKKKDGLIDRCARIRDYIGSTHAQHKKALDYKKVQKAVMNMRGIRVTKKPPASDDNPGSKSRSISEQSFGSMLRVGKDVLEVVKTVSGYSPSNTMLTTANLTTFLSDLDAKNSAVAEKLEQYDDTVEARSDFYVELKERVSKVKLALSSQFGKDSNEYKDAVKY